MHAAQWHRSRPDRCRIAGVLVVAALAGCTSGTAGSSSPSSDPSGGLVYRMMFAQSPDWHESIVAGWIEPED